MKPKKIEPIDGKFEDVTNSVLSNKSPLVKPAKALLSGLLPIGDVELQCAVLENETRILSAASVFKAFNRSRKGMNNRLEVGGTKIPPFLATKNLKPYINEELMRWTKLIEYKDGKSIKRGYDSLLLPAMCDVYLRARRDGALTKSQEKLAIQAEILLTAFAKIGITALIDEATGYQKSRNNDALRMLLAQYIAEGLREWARTFPDSFFDELDRLYSNEKTTSRSRPRYYGKFINKYIYEPIEHGYVKAELDKLNITPEGKRRARFHQWLTDEGKTILVHRTGKVEGLMERCQNIEQFKRAAAKQKNISIAPYLFDEMNRIIE